MQISKMKSNMPIAKRPIFATHKTLIVLHEIFNKYPSANAIFSIHDACVAIKQIPNRAVIQHDACILWLKIWHF